MREVRTEYTGSAELWVDGAKSRDVAVELTGYVEVIEVRTVGAVIRMDGVTSWDGYLNGLSEHEQRRLVGKRLELRLDSGEIGRGLLKADRDGYLSGYGVTPF
jgi:hypothetical protein